MTANNVKPDPRRGGVGVFGGVDTHKRLHAAAAVDSVGRLLGTASFPAEPSGYQQLLEWLESLGAVQQVGVEGTGCLRSRPRPASHRFRRRGAGSQPPEPPDTPTQGQNRHHRRRGSSTGRAQRRRHSATQKRRRTRGGDQHPSQQPNARRSKPAPPRRTRSPLSS